MAEIDTREDSGLNAAGFVGDYLGEQEAEVPSFALVQRISDRHLFGTQLRPDLVMHRRTFDAFFYQLAKDQPKMPFIRVVDENLGVGVELPSVGRIFHDMSTEQGAVEVVGER